jgi:hypothetical protein
LALEGKPIINMGIGSPDLRHHNPLLMLWSWRETSIPELSGIARMRKSMADFIWIIMR